MYLMILQRLALELIWHIFYFPVWWYSGGIKRVGMFCFDLAMSGNQQLAPGLWLRNIFVPMFGQNDWQGRLMSFFMRSINILGRSLALVIWLLFAVLIFAAWIFFPMFVVVMLGFSF
jgi:hypothetical protein